MSKKPAPAEGQKLREPGSGFAICCGKQTRVTNSRRSGHGIHRRRACDVCGSKYTTMEVIAIEDNHRLLGSDMAMLTSLGASQRRAVRIILEALCQKEAGPPADG